MPADAAAIGAIHVAGWRAAYRGLMPDSILAALDDSERAGFWHGVLDSTHNVLVAELSGTVVGFCSVIPSRDQDVPKGVAAEIAALYVAPERWRSGVGRALCSAASNAALSAGFSELSLWVVAENERAVRFYEALGFIPDGEEKVESASGSPDVCEMRMRRTLGFAPFVPLDSTAPHTTLPI